MKKAAVFFTAVLLCASVAGCAAPKGLESESADPSQSFVSEISSGDASSDRISSPDESCISSTSSSAAESSFSDASNSGEYARLIRDLDDLKQVLNSLDQISEDDLAIPTP